MDKSQMKQLIEEWNKKHPDSKAADSSILHEDEVQEMIWCPQLKEWMPKYTVQQLDEEYVIVSELNTEMWVYLQLLKPTIDFEEVN